MNNNEKLRKLIEDAGLTQSQALTLFNKGLVKPYSLSSWKAYLSRPEAARRRQFDDALLKHAEKKIRKA